MVRATVAGRYSARRRGVCSLARFSFLRELFRWRSEAIPDSFNRFPFASRPMYQLLSGGLHYLQTPYTDEAGKTYLPPVSGAEASRGVPS
jgi:hypothetical protein